MKRAIVIGKFYPPHKGHKYLIQTAQAQADEVTVIVCDKAGQIIPGERRAAWLKEMAPGARVIVVDDFLPENDSCAWANYTLEVLGYAPDHVFTSEEYGEAYARFMGSRHVLVDKERKVVPISARKIRENPLQCWDYLDPCVRAYFAKRVCLLGAESSGTTTIAMALAGHYQTVWVPEFGRIYFEARMNKPDAEHWEANEFLFIAEEQNRLEDWLARVCNKILFCDTNSFVTAFWQEAFMGFMSEEVKEMAAGRKYDLYLITDIDIPFMQDGTRDSERRTKMHEKILETLKVSGTPFVMLSGPHETRLEKAARACDEILKMKTANS